MGTELTHRETTTVETYAVEQLAKWAAGSKAKPEFLNRLAGDIERLADELAGPAPTPTERLLARSAALDAFALDMLRGVYAANAEAGKFSAAQSEHAQRRIDRTHRRLLGSLRTLATVRRLALPTPPLHVNVAGIQQVVNVDPRHALE